MVLFHNQSSTLFRGGSCICLTVFLLPVINQFSNLGIWSPSLHFCLCWLPLRGHLKMGLFTLMALKGQKALSTWIILGASQVPTLGGSQDTQATSPVGHKVCGG